MAPTRLTHLDDPPSASSDEDEQLPQNLHQKVTAESSSSEESEQEEEEEESEKEEEEAITTPVKAPIDKPRTLNPNSETDESSSSEEEEEEVITPVEISKPNPKSEESSSAKEQVTITPMKISTEKSKTLISNPDPGSEPETELSSPTASAFTIKPSKKLNGLQTPEKNIVSKRPNSETAANGRKKSKVSNGDVADDDDEKKSIIKRVWSDGDEIVLLQGYIDYQYKKGCSPLLDFEDFHMFIEDSLPGHLSKSQVYDKVRRLKKKYRVNAEKGGINGDDPVFSKPHEHELFELSKKIWAGDKDNDKSVVKVKDEVKVKKEALKDEDDEMKDEMVDFETLYPFWSAGLKLEVSSAYSFPKNGITLIKQNLSLIGKAKAKEMEDKWKAHFDDESMLRLKRVKLLGDVCDVVAKAVGK